MGLLGAFLLVSSPSLAQTGGAGGSDGNPDAGETADFLLPAEATVEEDAEDPVAASVFGNSTGELVAASVLGDASCEAELFGVPCVAASGTGDASADGSGLVGAVAVSGAGDATADGSRFGTSAGVSGTGNATGFVAASGTGDTNGSAAATATGDAEGGYVVSGTGDAIACEHALLCLAVSGTGDADGEILATSGVGDAQGCIAVSGTGEAQSEDCPLFLVPVTVSEEASGCEAVREDADSEAACQDPDPQVPLP